MKTVLLLASYLLVLNFSISSAQSGALDFSFSGDGRLTTTFQKGEALLYNAGSVIQKNGKTIIVGDLPSNNDYCNIAQFNTDGSLDKTFSGDGKVILPISIIPYAVALQQDGKIVVAGTSNLEFVVLRINTDGTADNTFSLDGKVYTSIGSSAAARSIAIQSDGKLVVAGNSNDGSGEKFTIVRYNSDGTLDNSFNGSGIVTTALSTTKASEATAVGLLPDGKIVVAGSAGGFAVAKYNANGSLDKSFSGNGKIISNITGNDKGLCLGIQQDGKIVVGGQSSNNVSLVRYKTDGSLDNTFSTDGKVTVALGTTTGAESIAIQADGKIVAGSNSDGYGAILRFNGDGALDGTFSGDGKVYTTLAISQQKIGITLQPGGKIALSGTYQNHAAQNYVLFRYNADGNPDKTYNSDGIAMAEFKAETIGSSVRSVVIQSNKKIVVAGNPGLARYRSNGTLDSTFNLNGEGTVNISSYIDPYGIAIQTDGKIVVAGRYTGNATKDIAVVRLNSNGTIDNTFGTNGRVVTDFGNSEDFISNGSCVGIQADGRIVVAGYTFNPATFNYDIALARYNTNGTPDKTFDGDGKVTTDVMATNDYGQSIAIQPDGRIVVAGYSKNSNDYDFAVLRYSSNGALDNSFSGDGRVTFAISYKNNDYGKAVKIQPDGKIVVGGYAYNGVINEFAVARLNSDGSPDNGFSLDGKTTIRIEDNSNNCCTSVAIQLDGKIVLGGYYNSSNGGLNNFALVRYNTDGGIDKGFGGNDGKKVMDYGLTEDYLYASALQPDGQLVVAGSSNGNFAVARFLTAAAPITSGVSNEKKQVNTSSAEISLQQNIPNPFNHTTTINYSLPHTYSSAKIVVTNKNGKALKEINLSEKGKGSLNIDASTLAAGAYQYSLYVNGKMIDTREMVLNK